MTKKLAHIVFIFTAFAAQAQWQPCSFSEYTQVLKKLHVQKPRTPNYLACHYLIYNRITDVQPAQEYRFNVIQYNAEESYSEEFGFPTIRTKTYKMIIDSVEQKFYLTEPDQNRQTWDETAINAMDTTQMHIEKQQSAGYTKYQIILPKTEKYRSIEVWIDQAGNTRRTIFYAGQPVYDEQYPDEELYPRLEMIFGDYQYQLEKIRYKKLEQLLSLEEGKLVPTGSFKTYEIIDLRKKQND